MNSIKCKNCGNILSYNPNNESLTCDYCESIVPINDEAQLNTKKDYNSSVKFDETVINQFHCISCGSNLSAVKDSNVKRCPNCGSTELKLTNNISYVPDGIIPFKISKERATANFYEWIKKRKFAPNDLKKLAKLGKLSGLYTPVWNFDCKTHSTYKGIGVDEEKDSDGNVSTTSYHFSGELNNSYTDIMMSANKNISNVTLNSLGNFGLNNLKVYNPVYLCGFIGSDIDFDIHTSYKNFETFVKNSDASKAKSIYSTRYDKIENFSCNTTIYSPKYNYIYLPIWTNFYTYKDKKYTCYVNGYSGKVYGKSPKSFWKIFFLCLGIGLSVAIISLIALLGGVTK